MKYEEVIFKSIKYIERNIKEELSLDTIAGEVGYSSFHFSRIFKDNMGISIMDYVKERKLICASKEIFKGRKIIDVSEEYGYETHSGFSKAFKNKFGFTPTEHLIYAINIIDYLKNENGDGYIMNNKLNNANVFMEGIPDYIDKEVLYNELVKNIEKRFSKEELETIEKAYKLACNAHREQYRKSGEEYVTHSLSVSLLLSQMEVEKEVIIAGLLHDIIFQNTPYKLEQVKVDFSEEVADLINEFTNFNNINEEDISIDNSVLLIKLADRLHNMRTIKYMEPERYKEKAKETIEIFSPIAAKLNITKLKSELDDISLKYID